MTASVLSSGPWGQRLMLLLIVAPIALAFAWPALVARRPVLVVRVRAWRCCRCWDRSTDQWAGVQEASRP